MGIQNPQYLWLLLILFPVTILMIAGYYQGKRSIRRIAGGWRSRSLQEVYFVKTFFGSLCFGLFVLLGVFSLADVRWGDILEEDSRSGYEIVLAIDVSRSMLARDIAPSRLEASSGVMRRLIRDRPDTRFAIVLFKGKAASIFPMTEDLTSLEALFRNLSPDLLSSGGSNIQEGLRAALAAFNETGRYQAILLFSDGEALSGKVLDEAKRAAAEGIPILPVAVGSEIGAQILLEDGSVVRDRQGKPVTTRLSRETLQRIARLSGGKVFELHEVGSIWRELPTIWKGMSPGEAREGLKLTNRPVRRFFLLLALLFLIISLLIRAFRWRNTL